MKNKILWIVERISKKALAFLFSFSLVINMTIAGWPNFGVPQLGQDRLQDAGRIMQTLFATGSTFSTNPFDNTAFSGSVNGGIIDRLQWIQDKLDLPCLIVSGSLTLSVSSNSTFALDNINENNMFDYNLATGQFTPYVTGKYRIDFFLNTNGLPQMMYLWENGVNTNIVVGSLPSNIGWIYSHGRIVNLTAGNTYSIRPGGAGWSGVSGGNFLQIKKEI